MLVLCCSLFCGTILSTRFTRFAIQDPNNNLFVNLEWSACLQKYIVFFVLLRRPTTNYASNIFLLYVYQLKRFNHSLSFEIIRTSTYFTVSVKVTYLIIEVYLIIGVLLNAKNNKLLEGKNISLKNDS